MTIRFLVGIALWCAVAGIARQAATGAGRRVGIL